MKACVLHAIGDLRHEEINTPTPGEGEVIVRVGACGVCGSDIPRIFVKGTYSFPTVPGHELAGTVTELGPDVDPEWMNKRVAVFPLIPCRKCSLCEIGEYAQCTHYDYLGSRCDGGFAEYVRVPVWNLVPVPDGVTMEEAAMVEPAAVAIHALRQTGIDMGAHVAIFGAGPIGLLVGLWARAWGAGEVYLIDIDDARLEFAASIGFRQLCNARTKSPSAWIAETTGLGADVTVEASGSASALNEAILAARPFGEVILLGNPDTDMTLAQSAYSAVLRKQLRLAGTWNSSYSALPRNEWSLALDSMASGAIDVKPLVTHRVNLNGLNAALTDIKDRRTFSNKVMYVDES